MSMRQSGEITDPPITASQPETRFARSRPRPESPSALNPQADAPFCQRCLSNQQIINDILANYVPPDTHDWERQYKQHVKALQETYPPVCDDCEDRIRSKMQQSDYFVSAENLGRSLRRDDGDESWLYRRGWQYNLLSLVLTLGKLMWWTSWMGQCLWHALHLVKPGRHFEYFLEIGDAPPSYDCFSRVFSLDPLPATCDTLFTSLAGWSLVLGLLSIWWNPMWVKKLQLIYGRPMNKMEYYQLQVIFLLVRWVLWTSFEKIADMDNGAQRWKGYHAFAMAICLLVRIIPSSFKRELIVFSLLFFLYEQYSGTLRPGSDAHTAQAHCWRKSRKDQGHYQDPDNPNSSLRHSPLPIAVVRNE